MLLSLRSFMALHQLVKTELLLLFFVVVVFSVDCAVPCQYTSLPEKATQ